MPETPAGESPVTATAVAHAVDAPGPAASWLGEPRHRVWLLNLALAALAIGCWHLFVADAPAPAATHIPWWLLAALFFALEATPAVQFAIGGSRAWPMSEVAVVLGLFFTSATETAVAWALAIAAIQVMRRRPPYRSAFNLVNALLSAAVAFAVWQRLADSEHLQGAQTILAAVIAGMAIWLTTPLTSVAIAVHSGHVDPGEMLRTAADGLVLTLVQVNVGLVIAMFVLISPWMALLVVVPASAVLLLARGFQNQREQSHRLRYLYESSQALSAARDPESAGLGLLSRASTMFHVELAELILLPVNPGDLARRSSVHRETVTDVMRASQIDPVEEAFIEALPERGALRLQTARADPRVSAYMRARGFSDGLAALVRTEESAVGVLTVANHTESAGNFSSDAAALLGTLATQIGASFENTRLQQVSQAKTDYLSRMSHELRTPLSAIIGFSDLLIGEVDAVQAEQVQMILHAGEHLLALINDVLDIARIESGQETLRMGPVMVAPALRDCVELVAAHARERDVVIKLRVDPDVAVLADASRLRQVALNLVTNAVKYNRESGTVTITAERQGATVRIEVRDTGQGIAERHRPQLFEPFQRLGAERSSVQGTGLGLAVAHRLVEAMRGSIGVESVLGEGSRFWFELPAAGAVAAEVMGAAPIATQPLPGGERTVLCVEDNPAIRDFIRRSAGQVPGLHVITASRGADGVERARSLGPDLILLDLHLPDFDGDEVIRILREDPRTERIPVVILSADATPREAARLLEAGAADYITKPVRVQDLLGVIFRHTGMGSSDGEPSKATQPPT